MLEHRTHLLSDLPAGVAYQWLSRLVVPRPIALVSTVGADGTPNLAPFSFFMLGGSNPASLAFCPTLDEAGREKDTLRNVRETGEFVVNLVHGAMAEGVNATAYAYPPDIDEWSYAGFHPVESQLVQPSRVAESFVNLECRVHTITMHGSGPSASAYVIGEVLACHLAESLVGDDGLLEFHPIARLGGRQYLDLDGGKVFELARPNGPGVASHDL